MGREQHRQVPLACSLVDKVTLSRETERRCVWVLGTGQLMSIKPSVKVCVYVCFPKEEIHLVTPAELRSESAVRAVNWV